MWKTIIGIWVFGILIMLMMEGLEMTHTLFFGVPPVFAILGGLIVVSIIFLYAYLKVARELRRRLHKELLQKRMNDRK